MKMYVRAAVTLALRVSFALMVAAPSLAIAQDDPGIPKDVLAYFDKMVGEWKSEGTFLKVPFEGKASFRMAPGKHCLIQTDSRWGKASPKNVIFGTTLTGWDDSTKEIVQHSFLSGGGGLATLRGKMASPGRIEGSLVHVLGGKPNKADFELVEKSPGHWYFKSWNGNFVAAEFEMKKLDE